MTVYLTANSMAGQTVATKDLRKAPMKAAQKDLSLVGLMVVRLAQKMAEKSVPMMANSKAIQLDEQKAEIKAASSAVPLAGQSAGEKAHSMAASRAFPMVPSTAACWDGILAVCWVALSAYRPLAGRLVALKALKTNMIKVVGLVVR